MLIVVMMNRWFDDSACWVVHGVQLFSMLDNVLLSGVDVYCSVMFGTLVGVSMFSVIWSGLLMKSAINCPIWSSVYESMRVECGFTSPVRTKCGMFVRCCMQCCMSLSIVLWCVDVLSRGGIYMLEIVMCLELLICTFTILCILCIYSQRYVCFNECFVVSNERDERNP